MRGLVLLLCALLGGCTTVVRYTDELVDARTGRTVLVRVPATFGGVVGFVAGVPLDVVAIPAAWLVFKSQPKESRDPLTIFLFPSFVLWRVGTLLGMPIDGLEYLCWRAWQPADAMSVEERERFEGRLDGMELPDYPVEVLYPKPTGH